MSIFKGSAVAIVTPFKDDAEKSIDYDRFEALIEWHIAEGTDALVICGTTGESATMDNEEHVQVLKRAVEINKGRLPLIAGVGSNDTAHGVWLTQEADKLGVQGMLHVTPYYNKTTQKGLYEHFIAVADAAQAPTILYNVPGRTNQNLAPSTVAALAKHPRITAIKEASGNLAQVTEIRRVTPPEFEIFSGNDDVIIPTLAVGGSGVISVLANVVPKETHEMCQKWFDGDHEGALALQLKYMPLIEALFVEPNPIPVKTAMNMMGLGAGALRLPLTTPSEATVEKIRKALDDLGLLA